LLDGHEEDDGPPVEQGDMEEEEEVKLLSRKDRGVASQASVSIKETEEEPVEVVDSM